MEEGPQIKMVSMVNKMDNIYNVQVSGKAMVGVGSACLRRANKHRALAPCQKWNFALPACTIMPTVHTETAIMMAWPISC